jgi:toxin FitB
VSSLVDTNILGELARPRPDPGVVRWVGSLDGLIVSAITMQEIFFGLTAKPSARVQRWFQEVIDDRCRILDVTYPIARHAGILRGQLSVNGRVRTQADLLIAATAAVHGLTLATRNVRDFDGCGIAVLNPFS